MLMYISVAFWYLRACLPQAAVVWLVWQGALLLTRRRSVRQLPWHKLGIEYLFLVYVLAVLHITSVLWYPGMQVNAGWALSGLAGLARIPFVGASVKMVTLNLLLFLPYGFLLPVVFPGKSWSWKKALLIGLCSSLVIETIQLFTGRLCEVDDLISNAAGTVVGFLLWRAFQTCFVEKAYRRSLIQALCVLFVTALALFGLSFIANGDALEAQRLEAFPGMGNESDTAVVTQVRLYWQGQTLELMDADADWDDWYRSVGCDIGNAAAHYQSGEVPFVIKPGELTADHDDLWLEVVYSEPQTFRFENNPELAIEDAVHLLYSMDDGTLFYGTDPETLTVCWRYNDSEGSFQPDEVREEMVQMIEAARTP